MESSTKELVSNAFAQLFAANTLSFYKLSSRGTESGRQLGGCNFGNTLPINVPKCPEGKFLFFDKKFSKFSEFYYLEPGLYPSITDIAEAINTLIQERHNHCESFITVKVSRRTQS